MNINEQNPLFQFNTEVCCVCLKQDHLQFVTENKLLHDIFTRLTDTQDESGKTYFKKFCPVCVDKLEIISNFIHSLQKQSNTQVIQTKSCCNVCFSCETVTKFPQHIFDLFQRMTDTQLMLKFNANICYKCLNMLEETSTFIETINNNEQSMIHTVTIKQESNQALKMEIKEEIMQDEDDVFIEVPYIKTETEACFNDPDLVLKSEVFIQEGDFCGDNEGGALKMEIVDDGLLDSYKDLLIDCTVCNRSFRTTGGLLNHLKQRLRCRYQTTYIAQFWKSFYRKATKSFKCQVCLKYFSSLQRKDKHTKAHFGKSCILCICCGKPFIKSKEYFQHYRNHLTKQFPIKCKTCLRRFPTKCIYFKHLKIHRNLDKKRYRCKICYSPFTKKTLLINHKNKDKLTCPFCVKMFCKNSDLVNHVRSHTGEKPYQCDVCNWRFSFKGNLIKHSRIHTGYKPHICMICLKQFSRPDYLKSHYVKVHKKSTDIGVRRRYTKNQKKQTIKPQFVCAFCNKVCPSKSSLSSHIRVHNKEDTFQCTVCDKSFRYKGLLNGHMKIHLNYRPYACTSCPKTFIKRHDLTRHTKTHTREKNFKCEICFDRFSRKDVLRLHLRGHTGQRPYECEYCFKTFVQKSNLTHHLKRCKMIEEIDIVN